MGGPIVRSGATPEFSKNWDRIFGGQPTPSSRTAKKKSAPAKAAVKKSAPKATAKASAKAKPAAKKKSR